MPSLMSVLPSFPKICLMRISFMSIKSAKDMGYEVILLDGTLDVQMLSTGEVRTLVAEYLW